MKTSFWGIIVIGALSGLILGIIKVGVKHSFEEIHVSEQQYDPDEFIKNATIKTYTTTPGKVKRMLDVDQFNEWAKENNLPTIKP